VVGRETANKMSQKQTLFQMVDSCTQDAICLCLTMWNSLPHSICFCESLITTFQKHIQTFYFQSSDLPHRPSISVLLHY